METDQDGKISCKEGGKKNSCKQRYLERSSKIKSGGIR